MTSFKHDYNRLLVADFPACFRFYRDVLGFTPTYGTESDVYADFETGGATMALFNREFMAAVAGTEALPSTAPAQDRVVFVFGVDSVDNAFAELTAKGIAFVTEPTDRSEWGIRTAHFRDPDGNLLEIYCSLK